MATPSTFWMRALSRSFGLGLVAGGVEAVGLAASMRAPVGLLGFVGIGAVAMLTMGLVAALLAVPVAGVVAVLRPDEPDERRGATVLAVVGAGLCAWYLWGAALTLVAQDRPLVAAFFALLPIPFAFIVSFNAGYWLRRTRRGDNRMPWLPVAAVTGLVLVGTAAVLHGARDPGGRGALAGDPSVVLVSVSGVPQGVTSSDWLVDDADAVRFTRAITPISQVRGSAAALVTALHPLRAGVVTPEQQVSRGLRTVADVFVDEGYATAAFVGAPELVGAGLFEGFTTVDDRMGPLGGIGQTSVLWRLGLGTGERTSADVTNAALSFLSDVDGVPHFVWVHIDASGTDSADAAIERISAAVDAGLDADSTLLVVVGLTRAGAEGLSDDAVGVPLVVRAAGVPMAAHQVDAQVRIYDVGPTALRYAQLDDLAVTEGIELIGYGTGLREVSLPVVTLAPQLIGLRSGGVAYEQDLDGGSQRLFDESTGPSGAPTDVTDSQPESLRKAASLLAPEVAAYRARRGEP